MLPGRRLFFQGEMSFAEHAAYDIKHEKGTWGWSLWIFKNTALPESFYHLFKREKISHKVKKFLQHKFWSDLISTLHMFMYKFYTDCNQRRKKGKISQWNIKLKTVLIMFILPTAKHIFKWLFFILCPYRVQNRLMAWGFICRMSNKDDTRSTTSSKKKNQCSHATPLIPGLFQVSRD